MDTKENKLSRSVAAALIAIAGNTYAVADDARENYDLNGNGLIEINSLSDLNKIRDYSDPESEFNLNAPGCPDEGCTGFEFTADLDFDTNGDSVIDEANEAIASQRVSSAGLASLVLLTNLCHCERC